MESPKAGIILKENPLYDNSNSASSKSKKEAHPDVMSVMMADVTVEAAMTEMERKVNFLMKGLEEQDHEIRALREHMRTHENTESSQTPVVKATDKGKNVGNPKQHITYFVETCENAGSRGDQLVKQFIQSLKGNAFEWYTDLEPEVIDSWEQLKIEFLNCLYSTRRVVSMMELTNTKQQKGEPVIDYINQWRALSLDCKDKLTKLSAVEMCTQGMHWELLYILQGIKARTFEELATRAHDMELSIANGEAKDFLVQRTRSDKNEMNDTKKIANSVLNESMVVQETPLKSFSKRKETKHERNHDGDEKRRPTLRERQKKVYPFSDSNVAYMLEQLIEKQLIQLPEYKRPEQAGKVDDPNYYKYHQVISQPAEKYFVLKELILKLARENKIELDIDEVAQTNHVAVNMTSSVPPSILLYDQRKSLIQFGTFKPIVFQFQQRIVTIDSQNK
ncbi:retrotransposon gag protein [Cucumis melo var. makuwa]|uniref:Retrotransposon gag protein n=1 Tax=Cucumis melo var. makuwa TaxID=1194695 RepID=A0A5A7SMS3_CUCMM|nr:retrotransposon gag protein [Cucumis melo var. makuwa]